MLVITARAARKEARMNMTGESHSRGSKQQAVLAGWPAEASLDSYQLQ
jgi:hypothetical protein